MKSRLVLPERNSSFVEFPEGNFQIDGYLPVPSFPTVVDRPYDRYMCMASPKDSIQQ